MVKSYRNMGHVVLGSNTPIGSSIVRLLASVRAKGIIAASPSGTLPKGIDPKIVQAKFADVIDPYSLSDLFVEGDIVYNCQVISDERENHEDAQLYNQIGFINLLGVATSEKVGRIVCAFPQSLGYKLPEIAKEDDLGRKATPIQKLLRNSINIAKKYINAEPFGWEQKSIEKFAQSAEATANFVPEESSINETESKKNSEEEISASQPSGPKMPGSGPSMPNSGPSIPESSGPSLGGGPSLGPKPVEEGKEEPKESEKIEDSTDELKAKDSEVNEIKQNDESKEIEIYDPVPLIIARIAKLFGPFDPDITDKFCRSVRLQRIDLVGKMRKKITWINPIDAARAMILMGDTKNEIDPGQYLINGFTASPVDILNKLDEINHSKLIINHKILFFNKLKRYFLMPFRGIQNVLVSFFRSLPIGISKRLSKKISSKEINDNYYYNFSFNYRQVYDDEKAQVTFGWTPKFNLEATAKEGLNWFTSHQL